MALNAENHQIVLYLGPAPLPSTTGTRSPRLVEKGDSANRLNIKEFNIALTSVILKVESLDVLKFP